MVPHQNFGMFATGGCWTDESGDVATGYLVEYIEGIESVEESTWGLIKSLYQWLPHGL